jgi:hypothetical protein
MKGGSQAVLVRTDAGYYVCKWRQNPQHRRVLINEAISSQLLKLMRIATPTWAIVQVDEQFIRDNPLASISLGTVSIPVSPGPHFGSRVMPESVTFGFYDHLPGQRLDQVINLDDFFKVLVFDLWVDNGDGRQAIFSKADDSRVTARFNAQMIDNGFAFGFDGGEWRMRDRFVGKMYAQIGPWYLRSSAAAPIASAIDAARSIGTSTFASIVDSLPREWVEGDYRHIRQLGADLRRRADRLPDLVDQALSSLRETLGTSNRPTTVS